MSRAADEEIERLRVALRGAEHREEVLKQQLHDKRLEHGALVQAYSDLKRAYESTATLQAGVAAGVGSEAAALMLDARILSRKFPAF